MCFTHFTFFKSILFHRFNSQNSYSDKFICRHMQQTGLVLDIRIIYCSAEFVCACILSLCVLVNTWWGSGRHARAPNAQANQNQEKHPPDCGEKCRAGSVLSSNIISRKSWKRVLMEREQACNADWCLSLLMSLLRVSHTAADSHYDILQSCSSWIYEYVSADSCFWCRCATSFVFEK